MDVLRRVTAFLVALVVTPPPQPPPPAHTHFTAVSTLSVAVLVALFCCPPAHARVRALLRPPVVRAVRAGLPMVAAAQRRAAPVFTVAATAVSATVSVPFYTSALPAILWCIDGGLGVRLALLLGLALYVGNGAKDLVCAPRPVEAAATTPRAAKRVRVLTSLPGSEDVSAAEYGFPSSHVANTLVMNAYGVHYAVRAGLLAAGAPATVVAAAIAALWVAAVAASRVYMGMHAPVDVAGGAVLGALVAAAWSAVDDAYLDFLVTGGAAAAAVQAAASAVALRLHPRPLAHTTSFEASTAFAGACTGVALGIARGGLTALAPPASAAAACARLIAGLAAVAAVKVASKQVVATVVPLPYCAVPLRLRRVWQPPMHSLSERARAARTGIPVDQKGAPWDEIMTTKFVSYAALGWAVAEAAPRCFAAVGV